MKALVLTFVALAVGPAGSPPALAPMTPQDVVAGRRAAYYLSGALVSDMEIAVTHGADPKDQVFASQMVANWARVLPRMFPPGSNVPNTHANSNVWTDRAGFEAKAADYAASADKLINTAASGDRDAFLAQLQTTRAACTACHKIYHRQEQSTDGKN